MSDALPLLINQVDILIVGSVYQALRIHIISKCNQAPSNRSSGQIVINSAADWKNISIFDIDILTECEACLLYTSGDFPKVKRRRGCFTAQRYVKKKSKKSCDCIYISFAELRRIFAVYSDSDCLLYGTCLLYTSRCV